MAVHQEWRDISSYVSVEWSVAMETAAGRQLVTLGVFKTAAYQVCPCKIAWSRGIYQGSSQKITQLVNVQIRHDT